MLFSLLESPRPAWPSGSPWAGKAANRQSWARAGGKSETLPAAPAGLLCARVMPGSCQQALWLRCDLRLWAQQGKNGNQGWRSIAKGPKTESRGHFSFSSLLAFLPSQRGEGRPHLPAKQWTEDERSNTRVLAQPPYLDNSGQVTVFLSLRFGFLICKTGVDITIHSMVPGAGYVPINGSF